MKYQAQLAAYVKAFKEAAGLDADALTYGEEPTDDEALIETRKKNAEFIEENKEGICVFRFD